MRIARYLKDGREIVGAVIEDRVVELEGADVVSILEGGPAEWDRLAAEAAGREGVALDEVELLAPIARPGKFLGIGVNSPDHLEEAMNAPRTPELLEMMRRHKLTVEAFPDPKFPMVFNKQTSCIVGPHDPILIPRDSDQVDYEGEAVIVIGRRVRLADLDEARAAIAGWTVTNDVSVRDWQWETTQLWLGKSYDSHGPIGPWIVTADEFDPAAARIRTWVNGEQKQDGRLADQTLGPAQIVAAVSQVCALEPGDLIATGTPGGTGGIFGNYLQDGDRVRIEVTGIGTIDNAVVAEVAAPVNQEAMA